MQLIGWCELGISLGSYRPIFVDALVIVVENEISIDNPLILIAAENHKKISDEDIFSISHAK